MTLEYDLEEIFYSPEMGFPFQAEMVSVIAPRDLGAGEVITLISRMVNETGYACSHEVLPGVPYSRFNLWPKEQTN